MTNTDTSYTTRIKNLKAHVLANFHSQNPSKQLEGPRGITPSSTLTEMKLYQGPLEQNSPNVPNAPTDIIATAISQALSAIISWTAPISYSGYEITSFTVYIWYVSGAQYGSGLSSSSTTFTTPILPANQFQFSVTATNSIGESAQSVKSSAISITCLIGTTLIELVDGSSVELQVIQKNDVLTSYDPITEQICSVIVNAIQPFVDSVISINNGLLVCTASHTHYVKQNGLWSIQTKVYVGDYLLDKNMNEIEIISIVNEAEPAVVYNLQVSGNHLYYANGILTHNGK